ncbi:MAG: TonB-dependent receptor [Sphingomonadales bacterium]|nr:TonB-dependent receptor [Sphingomonadales bacterium]
MKKLLASTALGCAIALISAPSRAQSAAPDTPESTETQGDIVVTAQKRAQSVQDIPISMTVIGGTDLRRLQANDVGTIANQIPNVVATTSVNLPAFTIRGVGLNEFASNFDSPVAIHIDEVYKSKPYMASIPFYDIARVEALKGPQGTLFGRNTTGGSVNFYTKEPELEDSGAFNLNGDNFARFHVDGYVNKKLTDELAVRASYYIAQGNGGPYHNLFTGTDYGAPNQLAGRVQAKWSRGDTTIKLIGYGFRDKSELTPYKAPGLFTAAGAYCPQLLSGHIDDDRTACLKFPSGVTAGANKDDPSGLRETQNVRTTNAQVDWLANNQAAGASLRIEQGLGSANLVSITSFDYFRRAQTEDGDNTPYQTEDTFFYSRIKQLTQELRVGGKAGKLTYLVGGFFEHDDIQEVNSALALGNSVIGLPDGFPRFATAFHQKLRSLAVFTHNEFEVLPTVSIVAGVRYSSDRTAVDGSTYFGANDPVGITQRVTPVVPVDSIDAHRTDGNVSFRGGVNWKLLPDNMLYVSVARGFRSGGYSIPFGAIITSFSPERLTSYEAGYKVRLLDRTLDFNVAGFRYDYKNLQVNVDDPLSPVVPITRNIGASRTWGAEADLTWRPTPTMVVRLGGSYLDAKYVKTDRSVSTYIGEVALLGKRPVNTPKWTAQTFVQKAVHISDSLDIIAQTDAKFISARFLETTDQPFDRAPAYWLQNARLTLANPEAGWELAIWGRNIWNRTYLTYINNISFNRVEIYGDPGSYGVSAGFKF